eukprot:scaffold294494_cov41-Tisochrysis_lutea.AAC.1
MRGDGEGESERGAGREQLLPLINDVTLMLRGASFLSRWRAIPASTSLSRSLFSPLLSLPRFVFIERKEKKTTSLFYDHKTHVDISVLGPAVSRRATIT